MLGSLRTRFPRFCAIAPLFATVLLAAAACATKPPPPPPPPVVAPPPPPPVATNPLDRDQPNYMRLPGLPQGTPVRVGVILPLSSGSAATRNLAQSMLKAAELAMFDSGNRNILLMVGDEGNGGAQAADAARKLLAQGAEVIVGPLFGASVAAVAPVARDRGVPVLAFSTERSVAGNGAYLISFLPQNEVKRAITYAAARGHKKFAAMIPQSAYGDVALTAFQNAVQAVKGQVVDIERFAPNTSALMAPAKAVAQSGADAVLIAQGGSLAQEIAPTLQFEGMSQEKVQLLGTGLWDDASLQKEPSLQGSWYAAPSPKSDDAFNAKYRATFGSAPANLASLSYDAMSLVALLAKGEPYHRFTQDALMDPNGFTGVDGIFRFNADGTSERGLAVLEMTPLGPVVVSPAPTTFQDKNS
ncbi:MAG: penicillin-binding protein activator [Alphaproteobacteria bacterium]|nr:penicillin-binding protein activator [Alphaproteobacteria bacterium]